MRTRIALLVMLIATASGHGHCGPKSNAQSQTWTQKGLSYARRGMAATSATDRAKYYQWAAYCMRQAAAWEPDTQVARSRSELAKQYDKQATSRPAAGQWGRTTGSSTRASSAGGLPSPETMAKVYVTDLLITDRAAGVPSTVSSSAFRSRLINRVSLSLDVERYPNKFDNNGSLYQAAVRCGLSQQQFQKGLQRMMADKGYREKVMLAVSR